MGMLIRDGRRIFNRRSAIVITIISLIGRSAVAGVTNPPPLKPSPPEKLSSYSLPSEIVTTDGKVYHAVKLSGIQPDGLLVQYQPHNGGIGLALLKFAKLPGPLQKEFGYNPQKASAFEHEQSLATFALTQRLEKDEKVRTAMLNNMSQRLAGTVSVSASDPTVNYTYYAPGKEPDSLGDSIAICQHSYQCQADFELQQRQGAAGQPIHFYVSTVTISLGLSCHITEPKFPYDKVRLYVEGDRKIYEYFYRFGPQVARSIGEAMIGREFVPAGTDVATAKKAALAQAGALVQGQYFVHLDWVAQQANHYYAKLTDYDENNYNRDKAIRQAIAKYSPQINDHIQLPAHPLRFPGNPVVMPPRSQTSAFH